jgi:hypothetical protein
MGWFLKGIRASVKHAEKIRNQATLETRLCECSRKDVWDYVFEQASHDAFRDRQWDTCNVALLLIQCFMKKIIDERKISMKEAERFLHVMDDVREEFEIWQEEQILREMQPVGAEPAPGPP